MVSAQELLNAEILIVDDQHAHVHLLERLLRETGYANVASTTDPRQVRTLHRDNRYDLILLDLQMPEMDGFRVMEALSADNDDSYLPVVAMAAQPGHKQRALALGAKDVISKPFDRAEVKTRIHKMLEMRLLYKTLASHKQELETAVRERTAELLASEDRYRRFTELASDWYWEQNERGEFTLVSGPVEEMLGLGVTAALGKSGNSQVLGWNEAERRTLQANIAGRRPFLDFAFGRVDAHGQKRCFRVSGEPMFDRAGRYTGFRGIGIEVVTKMSPASGQVCHRRPLAGHHVTGVHSLAGAPYLAGATAGATPTSRVTNSR